MPLSATNGRQDEEHSPRDLKYMDEALRLARSTQNRTWPNPPVGAVVVQGDRIVGRGAHAGAGHSHAEPIALDEAGEAARGATLYVTLEPCNHHGRTGPCGPRVAEAGISRVVVAMRDPNPHVAGGGARYLREHGIEVKIGARAEQALELAWPFVVTRGFERPYVELKTAVSLDGKLAPLPGDRRGTAPVYLTGSKARHDVHRRRRRVDLVLIGEGTARVEAARLDGRLARSDEDVPQAEPAAGYVDSDLSWTGGLDRDEYFVFAGEGAQDSPNRERIESDGGRIVFCPTGPDGLDPAGLVAEAGKLSLHTIMVEGGPSLATSFLGADQVDRWVNYLAPVVFGRGVGWPVDRTGPGLPRCGLNLTRCLPIDHDLQIIHDRQSFYDTLAQVVI